MKDKQELKLRKVALEKEIEDIEEQLNGIYHSETEQEIIALGEKHGLKLHFGMKIISTRAIADYVIKDNARWVNPPARIGEKLILESVSDDYVRLASASGWLLSIPIELIKAVLESEKQS